jgi:hypothetical protein
MQRDPEIVSFSCIPNVLVKEGSEETDLRDGKTTSLFKTSLKKAEIIKININTGANLESNVIISIKGVSALGFDNESIAEYTTRIRNAIKK